MLMRKLLQNVDLRFKVVEEFGCQDRTRDRLYRDSLMGCLWEISLASILLPERKDTNLVIALVHRSEGAFANFLAYDIWLDIFILWTADRTGLR